MIAGELPGSPGIWVIMTEMTEVYVHIQTDLHVLHINIHLRNMCACLKMSEKMCYCFFHNFKVNRSLHDYQVYRKKLPWVQGRRQRTTVSFCWSTQICNTCWKQSSDRAQIIQPLTTILSQLPDYCQLQTRAWHTRSPCFVSFTSEIQQHLR